MHKLAASFVAMLASATAALAEPTRVTEADEFSSGIVGRELTTLGVRLIVQPDGSITGKAFGRTVTGSWDWQQGYFCRELMYGQEPLAANCQMVTIDGNRVKFTSDRGTGQTANLRIR
jgi:hypothetical protein